jgi:hypothetical protein
MFHHLYCTGHRPRILAFAGTVALVISQPLWPASCLGPAPLEARVHSHPDADAYAALGIWFGENRKSEAVPPANSESFIRKSRCPAQAPTNMN